VWLWWRQQEATSSLKLPNVAGIFYILITGLCMSLVIAGVEFLHKSRTEARRRRVSIYDSVTLTAGTANEYVTLNKKQSADGSASASDICIFLITNH